MKIHTIRLPYEYGQTIELLPISCVHMGNTQSDAKAFKRYLKNNVNDSTYILGLGDLLDCIVIKDMKRYSKTSDSSKGDAVVDEQEDAMADILGDYAHQIAILGEGNHEAKITLGGHNPTKGLINKLERISGKPIAYGGYSWGLRIVLHENNARVRTILVRGHHGWGGASRSEGASLVKYWKELNNWAVDIGFYAHDHRIKTDFKPMLRMLKNKVVASNKFIGLTGTFLKTLSDTEDAAYSERAGYPPVPLGGVKALIKPNSVFCDITMEAIAA